MCGVLWDPQKLENLPLGHLQVVTELRDNLSLWGDCAIKTPVDKLRFLWKRMEEVLDWREEKEKNLLLSPRLRFPSKRRSGVGGMKAKSG